MTFGNRICFLHVGTGKTGSSAIQYSLTTRHAELLKAGFLYPNAARNFAKVRAGWPTAGNGKTINSRLHAGNISGALDIIGRCADSPEHLVISCEGFANVPEASLGAFRKGLVELGYTPKALVVFRPQVDMAVSSYLQQVKANKGRVQIPLDRYAEMVIPRRLKSGDDWYSRAKKLERAFGDGSLTVRWYPALRRDGFTGVPAAAFEWLGLPSPHSWAPSSDQLLVNPTPTREALVVLQEINAEAKGGRRFADEFLRAALERNVGGSKVNLSRVATERIHALTVETNKKLLEEYCTNLNPVHELGLPDLPDSEEPLDQRAIKVLRELARDILARHASEPSGRQIRPGRKDRAVQNPDDAGTQGTVAKSAQKSRRRATAQNQRICFLHVGMGKTGSSAIQYALTEKCADLLRAGLLYPDMARDFKDVLLHRPTPGNGIEIQARLVNGDLAGALRLVRNCSRSPEHLVLSCEGFALLPKHVLEGFADGLSKIGYTPKALAVFRPQAERLVSSYLQQVKANKQDFNLPLDEYAEQVIATRLSGAYNWHARANKLESSFGQGNLTVFWYPALRRRGLDAIPAAAFEWLGVPQLYTASPRPLVINPTPSREALIVLQEVNRTGIGGQDFADKFLQIALERGVAGTKVTLRKSAAMRIHFATLESNKRLLAQYCPDLDPVQELRTPDAPEDEDNESIDEGALKALREIAAEILGRRGKALKTHSEPINGRAGETNRAVAPRCIIHVGMHKTGSTSIQKSLIGFEDEKFVYADLGNFGNHSVPIYSLFSHRPEQHHIHRSAGRNAAEAKRYVAGVRNNLERELARAGGRTLIISGEDISVLRPADLAKLHEYFKERVSDLRIVAYVRAPAGLMASRFQQLVKGGTIAALDFDRIYRSYEGLLAKFDDVFGRDRVELWKFDPNAFPNGDVVQDFCARLGIDLPKNRIVRMNESISRQAVSLLYSYTKSVRGPESKIRAPEAIRLGEMIAGEKFRFSPRLVQSVLKEQEADIAWIERRLGASLQENLGVETPGDIRDESDLLRPDPDAVSRLLKILGSRAPEGVKGETTEEVAQLVAAWRKTLSRRELRWKNRPDIQRWLSRRRSRTTRRRRGIPSLLARFGTMLRSAYRRIAPQRR